MPGPTAILAILALAAWSWLLLLRGSFWRASEMDAETVAPPAHWPAVTAIVPARNEAALIGQTLPTLLAQDYPGEFRIILVDDNSTDGTAVIARSAGADPRLTILPGAPLAPGWTGKLWALEQGIRAAGPAPRLWLTDADIAHAPDTLTTLVARAEAQSLVLHSLMARLRTETLAEKAIVPAFIWFFQMLYPFGWVNRPGHPLAAAAGGCVLLDAASFRAAGGVAAIRGQIIDDCALGRLMKARGPIRLSLTGRARSLRASGLADLFQMIARSAYAQLGFSPALLLGTLLALALLFVVPPVLTFTDPGAAGLYGTIAFALMMGLYQPMLRFYGRSPLWALALPLIAAFYGAATLWSAVQHWRGAGGQWKGRAQARLGAGA